MSLQQGQITRKSANELADTYGTEYLRGMLQSSWAKEQRHERLSATEETVILVVLGERENLAERERQEAQAREFDRQNARHMDVLEEAKKAREVTERSAASAQIAAIAAEKSVHVAEAAVVEAARSATAAENQAQIARTAVGVSQEATEAARLSAGTAKKQFWLSVASLVVSLVAIVVSVWVAGHSGRP